MTDDIARAQRDVDWLKRAQELWVAGFRARQGESPPHVEVRRTKKGRAVMKLDTHASLLDLGFTRAPTDLRGEDRTKWLEGWESADRLAVANGAAYLRGRDPTRPPPRRRVKVAEPIDLFGGEYTTSRAEGRRILHPAEAP